MQTNHTTVCHSRMGYRPLVYMAGSVKVKMYPVTGNSCAAAWSVGPVPHMTSLVIYWELMAVLTLVYTDVYIAITGVTGHNGIAANLHQTALVVTSRHVTVATYGHHGPVRTPTSHFIHMLAFEYMNVRIKSQYRSAEGDERIQ